MLRQSCCSASCVVCRFGSKRHAINAGPRSQRVCERLTYDQLLRVHGIHRTVLNDRKWLVLPIRASTLNAFHWKPVMTQEVSRETCQLGFFPHASRRFLNDGSCPISCQYSTPLSFGCQHRQTARRCITAGKATVPSNGRWGSTPSAFNSRMQA